MFKFYKWNKNIHFSSRGVEVVGDALSNIARDLFSKDQVYFPKHQTIPIPTNHCFLILEKCLQTLRKSTVCPNSKKIILRLFWANSDQQSNWKRSFLFANFICTVLEEEREAYIWPNNAAILGRPAWGEEEVHLLDKLSQILTEGFTTRPLAFSMSIQRVRTRSLLMRRAAKKERAMKNRQHCNGVVKSKLGVVVHHPLSMGLLLPQWNRCWSLIYLPGQNGLRDPSMLEAELQIYQASKMILLIRK